MTLLERIARALFISDESWKRSPRKWEELALNGGVRDGYLRLAKAAIDEYETALAEPL